MSAEETRLAIALAAGPAGATLLAALLLLVASAFGSRPWRWLVWPAGLLLAVALGAAGGALVLSALSRGARRGCPRRGAVAERGGRLAGRGTRRPWWPSPGPCGRASPATW